PPPVHSLHDAPSRSMTGASLRHETAVHKSCERRIRSARSVRAAGAAAAHLRPLGQLLALFHLEGVAAATGRDGVRVLDLEPGLLDRVQEVDGRAMEIGGAERVDDHGNALELELEIPFDGARVEPEPVLEA